MGQIWSSRPLFPLNARCPTHFDFINFLRNASFKVKSQRDTWSHFHNNTIYEWLLETQYGSVFCFQTAFAIKSYIMNNFYYQKNPQWSIFKKFSQNPILALGAIIWVRFGF